MVVVCGSDYKHFQIRDSWRDQNYRSERECQVLKEYGSQAPLATCTNNTMFFPNKNGLPSLSNTMSFAENAIAARSFRALVHLVLHGRHLTNFQIPFNTSRCILPGTPELQASEHVLSLRLCEGKSENLKAKGHLWTAQDDVFFIGWI